MLPGEPEAKGRSCLKGITEDVDGGVGTDVGATGGRSEVWGLNQHGKIRVAFLKTSWETGGLTGPSEGCLQVVPISDSVQRSAKRSDQCCAPHKRWGSTPENRLDLA